MRVTLPCVFWVLLFAVPPPVPAQEEASGKPADPSAPPQDRLPALLATAAASDAALRDKLPSFFCKERAVSRRLRDGKEMKRVELLAELTVRRRSKEKLYENFEVKERDGVPFTDRQLGIPLYVSGGFQDAMIFFSSRLQPCYRYTLTGMKVDFAADPLTAKRAECKHESPATGFALFNANGDMIHVERRVPDDIARRRKAVSYAAIDLAPVSLNGHIYWLSSHISAEMPITDSVGRFEADYTGCRLFGASITLRPGSVITGDTSGPGPN